MLRGAAGIKKEEKLEAARPAFGESSAGDSQGMAQATVTPLVLGEALHPPTYDKEWNEVSSRKFLGAYMDYEERLQIANQEGGVRHTKVPVGQLIPAYIRQCFELMYTDGRTMTAAELLNAVKQHAGFTTTGGRDDKARAAADIRRILRMAQDGPLSVKDRAMTVTSNLEQYFLTNVAVQAMYRAQDRSWLPGPPESVSLALVDGLAPPAFKAPVKTLLTYVEGWKRNPTGVMKTIYEAADK